MDSFHFERLITVDSGLALGALTVIAFAIGAVYGVMHTGALSRASEAALMCAFGGLVSRIFVSVLLDIGHNSAAVALLVGWGFFLVPGVVDSVLVLYAHLSGGTPDYLLTQPNVLLAIAMAVGCAVGAGHGTLRTYDFNSLGSLQFLLDLTWGLCGSTTASLVLCYNSLAGTRPQPTDRDESRSGANRFVKGFHVPGKDTFAFTQGATMSNLSDGPGTALWVHERLHVTQNRVFGPFYTVSYLGWMAVFLVITPFIALFRRQNIATSIQSVCYFSNPWETWAYFKQRRIDGSTPANDAREAFCKGTQLSEFAVAVLSVPWAAAFVALPVLVLI